MNSVSRAWATALAVALFGGCTAPPKRVAAPPEIIKVPQYMPLPADCAAHQPVSLPVDASAADVMLAQRAALDAYADQVDRCFGASHGT